MIDDLGNYLGNCGTSNKFRVAGVAGSKGRGSEGHPILFPSREKLPSKIHVITDSYVGRWFFIQCCLPPA